jgi:hypothetical protein
MNKNQSRVYSAAGAIVALLLVLAGHLLDIREPRLPLERQVAYNWLTLLLSPPAFLLRMTRPDDFIIPSVSFAVYAVILNAIWYSIAGKLCRAFVSGNSALEPAGIAGLAVSRSRTPSAKPAFRQTIRRAERETDRVPEDLVVPTETHKR